MSDHEVQVLLVEDSYEDLQLTMRALRKAGADSGIDVVRDGAEALDYIFCQGSYAERSPANMPRVVLLDLKLPKLDGLEVLQRLRADPRTRDLPVVMLTSSNEQVDVVESYRLGVNSYIVKPVDFDKFMQAVQQLGVYWIHLNTPPQSSRSPESER